MLVVQKGSTDVTTFVELRDSADGTIETGYTITDLDLQYTRERTAPAAKVDATALAATNSAHSDNKAIELDSSSSPGQYRVDWPDAAFASGVDSVRLVVSGSGLDPWAETVILVDYDPTDSTRLGLTALPDANAEASGGLPTIGTGAGQVNPDGSGNVYADVREWLGTAATTSSTTNKPEVDAASISDSATAANSVETNISNLDQALSTTESNIRGVDSDDLAALSGQLDNIHSKTTNLPADPADESTLEAAISTAEANIRGDESDTLKTLSEQVDAVHAKTTNLPTDPADQSLVEAAITLAETNIRGADSDTLKTLSDALDDVDVQIVAAPLQASLAQTLQAATHITVDQHSSGPSLVWVILDSNDAAVDLDGDTIRLHVYDSAGELQFSLTTTDGDITIGGDSNNEVTVTYDTDDMATSGSFKYYMWRIGEPAASDLLLANGNWHIRPAGKETS